MRLTGLGINLLGWAIAMSGLFITQSNSARILIALLGIGVSLFGIIGVLNKYYLDRAIWKR